MDAVSPSLSPHVTTETPAEVKKPSIVWRIISVAGPIFISTALTTGVAIVFNPEIVVVVIAGIIGIITGLAIAYLLNRCFFSTAADKNKEVPENKVDPEPVPIVPTVPPETRKSPSPVSIEEAHQQFLNEQEDQLESITQVLTDHLTENCEEIKLNDEELNRILHVVDQTHHYLHNQEVFKQLKEQVIGEFGDELILDQVLQQLDTGDYLTGRRHLGDETKQMILECVRAQQQAHQEFDILLEKVQTQAQRDLFLDDPFIEKTFNVTEALKPFSPEEQQSRRETLQKIINQAYINREFKQKGKLTTGEKDEISLLSCLGFNVKNNSHYQDKEFVYKILQDVVQNQLRSDLYTGSLVEVKETMKACALKARLQAAGVETPLQVEKFEKVYAIFQGLKDELVLLHQSIELALPADFPLDPTSLSVRNLQENFEFLKSCYIYNTLERFFKNKQIKTTFQDEQVSAEDLCDLINRNHQKHLKRDQIREKCLREVEDPTGLFAGEIAFYRKWGKYLKTELIQGFPDAGEALGRGVCWGVCQRVSFHGQTHPDITSEELAKEVKLTARDRFFQGAYKINGTIGDKTRKPPQAIAKAGFKSERLFDTAYDANEPILTNYLTKQGGNLVESAGWLMLSLGLVDEGNDQGHAILVRWDITRQCFWIMDPNVGLLCFEDEESSVEEAQQRCLDCLKDLIAHSYPTTFYVGGYRLTSKSS